MHDISYGYAILLGFLQGLTEFLPVSSTAHMAVVPQLLGQEDPGATFSAIAQLGPIIAMVVFFRKDLVRYVHGILRHPNPSQVIGVRGEHDDVDARLGWYTLIGSIPLLIAGVVLQHLVDTTFRRLDVIAVSLIVLAGILWWAEKVAKQNRSLEHITFSQSIKIGLAQILALVPGASRSGVTITAGLFQGLDRESATRFSFLLSIPAIVAAGLFKLVKELLKMRHGGGHLGDVLGPAILAAIVAGVFAYIVVRWFLGFMKEHSTNVFVVYRIALGVLILFLLATHKVQNKVKETDLPSAAGVTATAPSDAGGSTTP